MVEWRILIPTHFNKHYFKQISSAARGRQHQQQTWVERDFPVRLQIKSMSTQCRTFVLSNNDFNMHYLIFEIMCYNTLVLFHNLNIKAQPGHGKGCQWLPPSFISCSSDVYNFYTLFLEMVYSNYSY